MTHVVTENCDGCRFTDCVTVCPVACFHGDEQRLYIDPQGCIDCGACVPVCPVHAIACDIELPMDQRVWLERNADASRITPVVSAKQLPLPGADARKASLGC